MITNILLGLVGIVAALLAFAATRPAAFQIQRKATIKAAPEKIFAQIVDFHNWSTWSPWEKLDPTMKRTFSGAEKGKGTVYEWEGNSKAGKGRMEITDVTSATKIVIQLDFIKPFEAHNITEFTLDPSGQPGGDSTTLTWTMRGPSPFMSKLMGIFINLDTMVGKDFDAGLANLKRVVET